MSIQEVLKQNEQKDLLRFLTCGSVDDGKSTLIGRLLHDSKEIYEDHLAAVQRDSKRVGNAGEEVDLSLLLDGLKAEREQGITIDVAYRYFSTPKRKFIIADCPGHEQYTRNMATGASTANLAIVLVDAKHGIVPQTKRHSSIVSLLDIGHIVVAVNKMDLVDYSEDRFEEIRRAYTEFATRLEVRNVQFIPLSALKGDNVVDKGDKMPWYKGPSVLEYLETVHIASERNFIDMRFPVQYVQRQDMSFRGYSGSVASGVIRKGNDVVVLPSGKKTKIKGIHTFEGEIEEAFPPMAVTLTTEDELDISRGDILVRAQNVPRVAQSFDASVVWMNEESLDPQRNYRLKRGSTEVLAQVSSVRYRLNINSLGREETNKLNLNEIGRLNIETSKPLVFDPYKKNRATGSFILIDTLTNATVAAGMILDRESDADDYASKRSTNVSAKESRVLLTERMERLDQRPFTIWLTGLPNSGKSTIAYALERKLFDKGLYAHVLDGENLRLGVSENLSFSSLDRSENIRRAAHLARTCNNIGLITIVAVVSPSSEDRDEAMRIVGPDRFMGIFVDTPIDVCESRDTDGLYEKARKGEIKAFTGVSAPYETPTEPAIHIKTVETPADEAVSQIVAELKKRRVIS